MTGSEQPETRRSVAPWVCLAFGVGFLLGTNLALWWVRGCVEGSAPSDAAGGATAGAPAVVWPGRDLLVAIKPGGGGALADLAVDDRIRSGGCTCNLRELLGELDAATARADRAGPCDPSAPALTFTPTGTRRILAGCRCFVDVADWYVRTRGRFPASEDLGEARPVDLP